MTDSQRGRIRRSVNRVKLAIADTLNLHKEPVFRCPVEGCEFTGNYGRVIWSHQFDDHHDRVMADE
jgi:hypothetical protein